MEIPQYKFNLKSLKLLFLNGLIAIAYVSTGLASFSLSVSHNIVTLVVFAAEGVALAAVVLLGPGAVIGVFFGQLVLALVNGLDISLALGISLINSVEALFGFYLLRRLNFDTEFKSTNDVSKIFSIVFLVLQPFSATMGVMLLWLGGVIETDHLLISWTSWWLGNSLGQVLVAPTIISFFSLSPSPGNWGKQVKDLLRPAFFLTLACGFIFLGPQFGGVSIAFAIIAPMLIFIGIRGGMRQVTFSMFLVASLFLYFCAHKRGPFLVGDTLLLLDLNVFLLGGTLISQLVATLFAERYQIERKLAEHQAKLFYSAKMSSLGEMAGGIAHEINNPLAIILGRVTVLKELQLRGKLDSVTLAKGLENISLTVDRATRIVKGLVSFSRNSDQEEFSEVSLERLIQEVIELSGEKIRSLKIDIRMICEPDLLIDCRPTQISQVIMNLLSNACDAVEDLKDPWIQFQAQTRGDFIELFIIDCGLGIKKEIADKMMQPFYTSKSIGKGTGLGLSISYGIIAAHGGSLHYDLYQGHTRFTVKLLKRQRAK